MPTAKDELRGKIEAKRNRVAALLKNKNADGTYNLDGAQRDELKAINAELNDDLGPKYDQFISDERTERENAAALKSMTTPTMPAPFPGGMAGGDGYAFDQHGRLVSMGGSLKSIGEQFIESDAYKSYAGRRGDDSRRLGVHLADFDVKTLFQTSAGWAPFVERRPGIVMSAQQLPRVVDLIPAYETSQASIKWMLETGYTSAAAEVAEAGTYQESAFVAAEQTTGVNKFGVTLPATDEQYDDVPGARDYINNRLTLQLRQRLDTQLVVGNGTAPNMRGMLNIAGIQTQAKGAAPDFDAILNAMNLVQAVGFADPTAILMHPTDWTKMRLIRSNGLYVLGNPGDAVAPRLWGLPVVTTTFVTATNAIVADFANYTELWYRRGITFDMTNSHAAEFLDGKQRVRASFRAAFVVTRPSAICQVTGLAGT